MREELIQLRVSREWNVDGRGYWSCFNVLLVGRNVFKRGSVPVGLCRYSVFCRVCAVTTTRFLDEDRFSFLIFPSVLVVWWQKWICQLCVCECRRMKPNFDWTWNAASNFQIGIMGYFSRSVGGGFLGFFEMSSINFENFQHHPHLKCITHHLHLSYVSRSSVSSDFSNQKVEQDGWWWSRHFCLLKSVKPGQSVFLACRYLF